MQPVFDQYLRDVRIPTLEYEWNGNSLKYRWIDAIDGFNMPVEVEIDGSAVGLSPTTSWQTRLVETTGKEATGEVVLNPNFYVGIRGM